MSELGIHTDLPAADYHRGPGVSKSGIVQLLRSPAHYRVNTRIVPKASTDAQIVGDMIHAMTLEPWRVPRDFVIGLELQPGEPLPRKKNVDKEAWAQFEAEHDGKAIVRILNNNQNIGSLRTRGATLDMALGAYVTRGLGPGLRLTASRALVP